MTAVETVPVGRFAWFQTLGRDGRRAFAGAFGGFGS
jgi:hypothetical protein